MVKGVDGVSWRAREPVLGLSTEAWQTVPGPETAVADAYPENTSKAFVAFYALEYPKTVRLAELLCGSSETAEDVTQEAFLALSSRFETLEAPALYLRKSVVNSVRRLRRDRQLHETRLRLLGHPVAVTDAYDLLEMADAVADLPFRQRVVVVGRYWAGWSEAELADLLGCRPGTVKSLASRALTSLRGQIGRE
jgi:RNA polymerase sigma factor (sigma-70 family)